MSTDFRSRLLASAEELRARLTRVEGHLRKVGEPALADGDEQFLLRQSDEVIEALAAHLAVEIEETEQALRRLDGGHYGTCVRCAKPIGTARLAALPAAACCADCARLVAA